LVHTLIKEVQTRYDTPILLEPETVTDLSATVQGTIPNSPAREGGIKSGDIIQSINGAKPRSRVHAFNLVESGANPQIRYKRSVTEHTVVLNKGKGARSGLVMHYDMSPLEMDELLEVVESAVLTKKRVMVLTSALGHPLVSRVLEGTEARVETVENNFFGGNIAAAGLLTVADFSQALSRRRVAGWLVVVPHKAFDLRGRDLTGSSYLTLQEHGCRVVLV